MYTEIGHGDTPVIIWSITEDFEWDIHERPNGKKFGHSELWIETTNDRWLASGRIDIVTMVGTVFIGDTIPKGYSNYGKNLKILNMCTTKYPHIRLKVWYGFILKGDSMTKAYEEFEGRLSEATGG